MGFFSSFSGFSLSPSSVPLDKAAATSVSFSSSLSSASGRVRLVSCLRLFFRGAVRVDELPDSAAFHDPSPFFCFCFASFVGKSSAPWLTGVEVITGTRGSFRRSFSSTPSPSSLASDSPSISTAVGFVMHIKLLYSLLFPGSGS